jgi:hypothetical protein
MKAIINSIFLGVIFIFGLSLTSCKQVVHEGKVIGKEYEPTRTYVLTSPMMVGKMTMLIPYVVTDNEDFILDVKYFNGKDSVVEAVYVDKAYWNCIRVNDTFNDSIPCSTEDNNNEQVEKWQITHYKNPACFRLGFCLSWFYWTNPPLWISRNFL